MVAFTGLVATSEDAPAQASPVPANNAAPKPGKPALAALPIGISDKPLSLKQTIAQLKKRLVVVERGIRERAELEQERAAIHRLIEAAKAPGAEVRKLQIAL